VFDILDIAYYNQFKNIKKTQKELIMDTTSATIAKTYYTAVSKKNIENVEKYLHPNIQFISPLAELTGKEAFIEATKKYIAFFNTLKIRTVCGSTDQAMVVYDVDLPSLGKLPTAVLMTFQEELITKIELFFDARRFEKK
jgi:hypothetical protein